MSTCFGSSGLGASVCSYKTRGNGRHRGQAASIRTTLLGCGLTSRSTPTLAVTARPSRNCKCKATTAVAAVEQEPFKPATTAKPTADQIFDLHHVTQMSPSLLLYFPIVLQRVLGLQINWHHADRIPHERHVLVSNHLTAGDLMMLYSLPQHYVHLISDKLPKRISQARHHRVRLWHATKEIYQDLSDSSTHSDPIHLFPEGVMTNGNGMVQFSRGFMLFGKTLPIVPVALRVTVPWNIQTHTLTSSFAANLFWFCFVPWVRLDATVLKPMSLAKGQGKGAFVEGVQKVIATELKVGVADMTNQEKKQLMKQYSKSKQ